MNNENNGTIKQADDNNWSATTVTDTAGFKTMAELNAAEPNLRDLEITVDGLNILDVQFAGPGVWVPRFTLQISGDQGTDSTGKRRVFSAAAGYLRAALLNNGAGDGTAAHTFVPHANIDRGELSDIIDSAIKVTMVAINNLENPSEGLNDGTESIDAHGHGLRIKVRTVDFDVAEQYVDGEGVVQGMPERADPEIEAGVNDWLAEHSLLRGEAGDINTELLKGPRPDGFFEELDVRNETKLFDGIQHKLLVIPTEEGSTETNKLWVPVDYQGVITTFDDLSDTALLTCLSAKGESPTEWRLLEKEALLSDVDTGDLFLVQTDDHVSVNDIIAKMTEHGIVSEGNAFNHKAVADYVEGYVAGALATAARKEPIHKELQSAVLAAAEKVAGVVKH